MPIGPSASAAWKAAASEQVGINWVVAGEFLAGALVAGQDVDLVRRFLGRYPLVQSSPSIIQRYAEIYASLKAKNALIGPNDLWIAASAMEHGAELLTLDAHFSHIPQIVVAQV